MTTTVIRLTDGREVVHYPFPVNGGRQIAVIQLPNEPLTNEDVDRMVAFIQTLVQPSPCDEGQPAEGKAA